MHRNFAIRHAQDFPGSRLELRRSPPNSAEAIALLQLVARHRREEPKIADVLKSAEAYSTHVRGLADVLGADPEKLKQLIIGASIAGIAIDALAIEGASHTATAADIAINSTHAAAHAIDGWVSAGALIMASLAAGGFLRGLTKKKRREFERLAGHAYWCGRLAKTLMTTEDMPLIRQALQGLRNASESV